jgi:hypothetical protein
MGGPDLRASAPPSRQVAAVALHRHHALPLIQTRGQFGQGTVDLAPAAEMTSSAST